MIPVTDSQVVKTTPVGDPERGYDAAKRHILVDTMSRLMLRGLARLA